jgi:Core-2/I-Branching enzyme
VARILALSPDGEVVLHHDQRAEPMTWSRPPGPRVHVIEPEPMDWGGFTMVTATMRVLEHVERHLAYDWCVLISGQDYPVTDLAAWEKDLSGDGVDYLLAPEEVNFDPSLPRRQRVGDEYYVRYAYRWRPLGRVPTRAIPVVNALARMVAADPVLLTRPSKGRLRLGIAARRTPFDGRWRCFKASQWMALAAPAVQRVIAVAAQRPELADFYATTLIPDESFVQSILCNETDLRRRDHRLTFARWAGSGSPHPEILGRADVEDALVSGCAFARKFDTTVDESALDALDRAVPTATAAPIEKVEPA